MSSKNVQKDDHTIAVVGAGSWGTALAFHLASKGIEVRLWVREQEVEKQIVEHRENKVYFPDITLPENIIPSSNLIETVKDQEVVLLVVPSQFMRGVVREMKDRLKPGVILASAAKGVENDTLMTISQILEDELPDELAYHPAVIAGPSFAREVGRQLPTAVTLASYDKHTSRRLQHILASTTMRVYTSQDIIGVEMGGALKNIYAIGAGIVDGLGLGTNARAALITRGLAEMSRMGVKMGANPLTFMGLAGMGDLVLTCTGDLSRNRTVGLKLGQGLKLSDILAEMNMVAEGVKTTKSVYELAKSEGVDMPLLEQIYKILYEDKDTVQALVDLMKRDLKEEIDHSLSM